MIADRILQNYTSAKYYQFYTVATILEHMIDCFHTIVSDETNPYHPPLSWLSRKPQNDELFLDLFEECSARKSGDKLQLSSGVRTRLEKCPKEPRKCIANKTKDGCSPLFMACKLGNIEIVKYLLETCEADIEQKGRYEAIEDHHVHSVSPLWMAAVSGHLDVVDLLINYGANVNSLSDTGSTPLRSVCFLCKDDDNNSTQSYDVFMEIVKLLVMNGADMTKPNYSGGTCLINSIHNYQLTLYIIDQGVDVNASDHQSKTALHYAIQQGRLDITKLLLSHGADPMLRADFHDDALQLACLRGHEDIFDYLTSTIQYPINRLSDAYKLLGSSILELHYDLARVRNLWLRALSLGVCSQINHLSIKKTCDIRRPEAFGDINEFSNESELGALSADDFRIQALIISERILGPSHKETIERLLYRGTFYINSLRPDRCIDLWIYALKLRLRFESIFHLESIVAAQAIMRLFFDQLVQQQATIKFRDVSDVLALLIDQLDDCQHLLSQRPRSNLHDEIFDLLLGIIVNLSMVASFVAKESQEVKFVDLLVKKLIQHKPQTSNGSSLLHVCLGPGVLDGDAQKLLTKGGNSVIMELVDLMLDNELEVDSSNFEGLSALQFLCLTAIRVPSKKLIIKRLVERGAHIDKRPPSPEQGELIFQSLIEAGVDPIRHITLSCLAARKVAECNIEFDKKILAVCLRETVAIH